MNFIENLRSTIGQYFMNHPDPGRAQIAAVLGGLALIILIIKAPSWLTLLVPYGTQRNQSDEASALTGLLKVSIGLFIVLYSVRVLVFY
jgi:hypothetical protein